MEGIGASHPHLRFKKSIGEEPCKPVPSGTKRAVTKLCVFPSVHLSLMSMRTILWLYGEFISV